MALQIELLDSEKIMSIMNTEYKITVVHDDTTNPDTYVDAAEIVLNKALEIGLGNRTGGEWLAYLALQLGKVAEAQLIVDAKLKGSNPLEIEKSEIFAYLQSLSELSAIALNTLTSLMYNIEREQK